MMNQNKYRLQSNIKVTPSTQNNSNSGARQDALSSFDNSMDMRNDNLMKKQQQLDIMKQQEQDKQQNLLNRLDQN